MLGFVGISLLLEHALGAKDGNKMMASIFTTMVSALSTNKPSVNQNGHSSSKQDITSSAMPDTGDMKWRAHTIKS